MTELLDPRNDFVFKRIFGSEENKDVLLAMNEPTLKKAMTTLEFLSQDAEARRLYEARQKYLHDEASMIEGAKTEGKIEVAKNMLSMGLDIQLIVKATGLTEEEIHALKPM
ncbi:conserved hypothetical protein (putative transposase or invertase) [Paenibacillus tianmuensis]|uniref:Transposase/invertase (TIGR01784 family) n=1 Tax=Paenibacillus tianmuensis TaxID=624147 RepID=A0A1G4R154_9BACL|nr:PD-(D/E)XK nuclease family transposase [Paenibacillus tianmuensis]SCW50594.1 conserved hypothetical protein (putative transposase or invertase) [Paenibacillus tianmuensis]